METRDEADCGLGSEPGAANTLVPDGYRAMKGRPMRVFN